MDIISRSQWGARFPAGAGPAPLPAREVWLHHSVTVAPDLLPPFEDEDQAMRLLEQIGQQRFGQGVSYTFAVMPTGRVYEGHGVDRLGAHTKGRNGTARGIVLVGNYQTDEPTEQQVEAVAQLLHHGAVLGWWTTPQLTGGHQQVPGAATACPGRNAMAVLYDINARASELETEDDMPNAIEIAQAVLGYKIPKGGGVAGHTTLFDVLAYDDWKFNRVFASLAGVTDAVRAADPVQFIDSIKPLLLEAVREGMAADNESTAEAVVDAFAARISAPREPV